MSNIYLILLMIKHVVSFNLKTYILYFLIERMKEGLAVFGVLNALQTEAGLLEQVFCGGAPSLSAATLLGIFTVDYSPRGSSRRALEEVAVGSWRDWLILVEGEFIESYKFNNYTVYMVGPYTTLA